MHPWVTDGGRIRLEEACASGPGEIHITAQEQQVTLFKKLGSFPSNVGAQSQIKNVTDPYFNNAPIGQIFSQSAAAMPAQVLGADDNVVGKAFTDAVGQVERTNTAPDVAWKTALDTIGNATGN